jgi:arsenate reductase-like glutaredoxin family protein
MTWKTNFDRYLEQHLSDSEFAERFRKAGESWDKVMRQSNDKENKTGKGIPRVMSKVKT